MRDGHYPTLGQTCHYVDEFGDEYAAIITRVIDDRIVNLTQFKDRSSGPINRPGVPFSETSIFGSWHPIETSHIMRVDSPAIGPANNNEGKLHDG